jgi:hypothetical protein
MRSRVIQLFLFVAPVMVAAACGREATHAPASPSGGQVASGAGSLAARDAGDVRARDGGADGAAGATRARRAPLDDKAACALPATRRGHANASAQPYTRAPGTCPEPFCDSVDDPPAPKDACFVANKNIARAEAQALAGAPVARLPAAPSSASSASGAPKWWDRVDAHLHFDEAESAMLDKSGFVVLDRLGYGSYAVAFHDVFQQELPVYVSVDSVMNAVFQASQMILAEVERTRLAPKLGSMLTQMRATLAASRARYGGETWSDLDVYLGVANALLRGDHEAASVPAADAPLVRELLGQVEEAQLAEVSLFGRSRMVDFSQLTPRGHYASVAFGAAPIKLGDLEIDLGQYFRAMMWLSRLELNLVSRSCRSSQPGATVDPSETPREARDALALADLASRAGVLPDLRIFEDTYSVFAGRREDVSVPDLLALAHKAKIAPADADAPAKLRAAIGDGWKRTARTHYMPEGATDLPAIATLMGPRIVPDVAPLTTLVHDRIPERKMLGAADVAYVLGHDRAKQALAGDLARYPGLGAALDRARADLAASARGKADVYSTWMTAITRLADPPAGAVPTFMRSDAYADMRMSSALAGYAQLRHTFVLLAGEGYDAYGCEIPDGWVEPAVGTYDALLAWARAAKTAAPGRAKYFRRVEQVLGMLRAIATTELAGAPLSEAQRRWLGMVAEFTPVGGYGGDSGEPPKWTGWYFDLFPDREHGAERAVDLVADYFTLTNAGVVRYLGVEKAALGAFVVDTGGVRRLMVGPVAKPYEASVPIGPRLDDEHARALAGGDKRAPWTASYLAPAKPEPPIATRFFACGDEARVVVTSDAQLGPVTVELLDHHGDALTDSLTLDVGDGPTAFAFAVPKAMLGAANGIEGVHLRVHDLARAGVGKGRWDFVAGGSVYPVAEPYPRKASAYGLDVALGSMAPPEPAPDGSPSPGRSP